MSRIIVDSIRNSSATSDGITLSSDGKVAFPNTSTGKILQVVHTAKTSEFTTTSTSYTDLTGFSASITPQTNSKVLVILNIHAYVEFNAHSSGEGYGIQLVRTPSGGSGTNVHTSPNKFEVYGYTDSSSNIQSGIRSSWHFLDSSVGGNGSTAITYKVQVANYSASMIRYSQDGNVSSITLMEIGA